MGSLSRNLIIFLAKLDKNDTSTSISSQSRCVFGYVSHRANAIKTKKSL